MTSVAVGTTVRPASSVDLDTLVTMAQHFVEQTEYRATVPSDAAHLRGVAERLLEAGVVFVAESEEGVVGMLAGLVFPHYLTGIVTASETAWWVEPTARGTTTGRDLLRAFEAWAREHGATRLELGSRDARLDRFYTRLGYAPVERVFAKEL